MNCMAVFTVFVFCILHLNAVKRSNVMVKMHPKDIDSLFTVGEIWGIEHKNQTEDIVQVEVVIDDNKLINITKSKNILGIDVIWADADEAIRKERERINNAPTWTPGMQPDIFFEEYRAWTTYVAFIEDLVLVRFPNIASRGNLPVQTLEGRNIPVVTLSTSDTPRPGLYIQGCIHAREWLACATVTKILDLFATGYTVDPIITRILDNINIYIVPVLNIDGYIYSWETDRQWRKNRRNNGDGSYGVDCNRNYDGPRGTHCTAGASTTPSSNSYCGPYAFSEPETQAARDFILDSNNNIRAAFDFHTSGQYIMWPWAWTTNPLPLNDYNYFFNLGQNMSDAVYAVNEYRYSSIQCATTFLAAGSSLDFAWTFDNELPDTGYALGFGTEGRGPGFSPPPTNINPSGEELIEAVIAVANEIVDGNFQKKKK